MPLNKSKYAPNTRLFSELMSLQMTGMDFFLLAENQCDTFLIFMDVL